MQPIIAKTETIVSIPLVLDEGRVISIWPSSKGSGDCWKFSCPFELPLPFSLDSNDFWHHLPNIG